jgi:elongation factor Ts
MGISAADVKELRERTSAGMLDCKEALEETGGDMEEAIEYLRKEGLSSAAKKAGRTANEGLAAVEKDDNLAVIAEVNSETDFAAKNDNFQALVDKTTSHLLANQPSDVDEALEQTLAGEGKTLQEYIKETIAQIGENISLRRFKILTKESTESFGTYIHMGGNIGVVVSLAEAGEELAKNIAMHIAAANPDYLSRDSVPEAEVEKEKDFLRQQAEDEGKPEHIVDQIVDGRLDKFFAQNCLLEQEYIKDTDKTVKELLEETDAEIKDFVRYEVGEGIEVEEEDFAEEVMSELDN